MALVVKNLPANAGDIRNAVWSLGWEDALEEGMATHSSILAWRIPWTEEPGRLQSMGSQKVWQDWATKHTFHFSVIQRKVGQLLVIMTLELGPIKAETLRWAFLSSIARENEGLPSALGFCHVGDLVQQISPKWEGASLDRSLPSFFQLLCCR